MKSNFLKYLTLALVLSMLITVGACAKPAPTPPPSIAEFEVISLDIKPPEAMAGETVSITAEVKNIGDSEGSYTAVLTVDGATVETKEVTLAPGASETVSFSLVKDAPGTYEIGIGELSSSLTVKEKLVVKEIELKYDDGEADGWFSSAGGGYLVDFAPPSKPFTIKKVNMCGVLFDSLWEGKNFEVEIWDKNYEVLYSATYPVTKFTPEALTWVAVEIPDIEVGDKFYIHVYAESYLQQGIALGADNDIVNEHSNLTVRTGEGISSIRGDWPYRGGWGENKSKVNFMIRVVGTFIES